jgi:hypothetical protein
MGDSSAQGWLFTASVPQKMLQRRRAEPAITELSLDEQRKRLSLVLAPKASAG